MSLENNTQHIIPFIPWRDGLVSSAAELENKEAATFEIAIRIGQKIKQKQTEKLITYDKNFQVKVQPYFIYIIFVYQTQWVI